MKNEKSNIFHRLINNELSQADYQKLIWCCIITTTLAIPAIAYLATHDLNDFYRPITSTPPNQEVPFQPYMLSPIPIVGTPLPTRTRIPTEIPTHTPIDTPTSIPTRLSSTPTAIQVREDDLYPATTCQDNKHQIALSTTTINSDGSTYTQCDPVTDNDGALHLEIDIDTHDNFGPSTSIIKIPVNIPQGCTANIKLHPDDWISTYFGTRKNGTQTNPAGGFDTQNNPIKNQLVTFDLPAFDAIDWLTLSLENDQGGMSVKGDIVVTCPE